MYICMFRLIELMRPAHSIQWPGKDTMFRYIVVYLHSYVCIKVLCVIIFILTNKNIKFYSTWNLK